MNTEELGRIIKEARIAKKMTQSQVVGTFITRNMLSQIENGTAMPSIKTLKYLSEILDLSDLAAAAFAEHGDEPISLPEPDGLALLASAKDACRRKDWNSVISTEGSFPETLADEFEAMLAQAFLALGKACLDEQVSIDNSGDSAQLPRRSRAAAFLTKARTYSDMGLYANASVKAEAVILLQQLAQSLPCD